MEEQSSPGKGILDVHLWEALCRVTREEGERSSEPGELSHTNVVSDVAGRLPAPPQLCMKYVSVYALF